MSDKIFRNLEHLLSFEHLQVVWGAVLIGIAAFSIVERFFPAHPFVPGAASVNIRASGIYLVVSPLIGVIPAVWVQELLIPVKQNVFWPIMLNMNVFAYWFDRPPSPVGYTPSVSASVLFSLAGVLVYDFFYYWFHRLQHLMPLWRQHKLHHTDTALSVLTTYRVHWLEDALRAVLITLPMGLVFNVTPMQVAWMAYIMPQLGHLIHANLRLTFGPFTPVFVGPQLHRIHHSIEPRHRDKNFAAFFPVWDILFGTYYRPRADEYPATGVPDERSDVSVRDILLSPFQADIQKSL